MSNILIVDDQEQDLYLLKSWLTGNGHQVMEASNGAQALELARASHPDVVISDILMPVMDGFSLCHEWTKDGALKNIPFVFYTATYTDPRDEELALSLGAARFIVKPIEMEEFLSILYDVLTKVLAHAAQYFHDERFPAELGCLLPPQPTPSAATLHMASAMQSTGPCTLLCREDAVARLGTVALSEHRCHLVLQNQLKTLDHYDSYVGSQFCSMITLSSSASRNTCSSRATQTNHDQEHVHS